MNLLFIYYITLEYDLDMDVIKIKYKSGLNFKDNVLMIILTYASLYSSMLFLYLKISIIVTGKNTAYDKLLTRGWFVK